MTTWRTTPRTDDARAVRILLVDDHAMLRRGYRMIFDSEPGLEVVGEATTGAEAIALVAALRPDVICMDVQMPDLDGIEATRSIVAAHPGIAILIVTTFDRDDYLFRALKAGASGFLLKNASPEELIDGVRTVAAGDALIAAEMTRSLVRRAVGGAGEPAAAQDPGGDEPAAAGPAPGRADRGEPSEAELIARYRAGAGAEHLTDREFEVLRLIAKGLSNVEIARYLVVSETTVKSHVSRMLTKLGLRDRTQAVIFAFETGLVSINR